MRNATLPLLFLALTAFGCGLTDSKHCTLLGCQSGTRIQFSLRGAGIYVFEVTVDGAKTTCTATLPLTASPATACPRDDVRLTLSGSSLPADQHSLEGLELTTTTARTITVRATRDGQLVGESTKSPDYRTGPPPNGEGCAPDGCTSASYAFP